jgi:dienelactone hydrolase
MASLPAMVWPLAALLLGAAPPAGALALDVTPRVSLIDAPVRIAVRHAAPGSAVTVDMTTTLSGNAFASRATATARADGTAGVDAMRLFWQLAIVPPFRHGPSDETAPRTVTVRVTNGAATAAQNITRLVLSPGIARVDVREDGVYGTGYVHPGAARRAGVIVLGGSEGGTPEAQAALLASHGFETLALGYFNAGPLPKALVNVPLEDVEKGVAWLTRRPGVDPSRIGILAGSKGAEMALLAASRFMSLRAVVALKPSSVVFAGLFYGQSDAPAPSSWSYGGVPLPYVNGVVPDDVKKTIAADEDAQRPRAFMPQYLARIQRATNLDAAAIPVERINGPVLLISGDDDQLWPSSYMADAIVTRLRAHNHPYRDQWLHYAHAGHAIGIAYEPAMESAASRFLNLGGTPEGNAAASADAWPRAVAFLRDALK